jgi:YHS domain-containing protein
MLFRSLLATTCALLLGAAAVAADTPPATDAAKATPYPLTTCIISGDKLDAMDGSITKVYDGQEIKFCCKSCIKTFEKDPAKYLKMVADQAAAAKAAAPAPAKADTDHDHAHEHH